MVTSSCNEAKSQEKKEGQRIDNQHSQHTLKRLFSIQEAAIYLGMGVFTVRSLIWAKELDFFRIGRRMLLDRADLDKFIEKHKTNYSLREADERPNNGKKKALAD